MPDLCACAHVCMVRARVHACVRVSVLTPPLHTWLPPVLGRLPRPRLRPPRAPGTVSWTIRLLCSAELGSALDQGSQSSHTCSSMWAGDTHHAHRDTAHTCSQARHPERADPLSGTAGSSRLAQEQGWGLGEGASAPAPSGLPHQVSARLVPRPPWRAGGHLPGLHVAVPLLATRPVVWGQGSRVDLWTLAPHPCGALRGCTQAPAPAAAAHTTGHCPPRRLRTPALEPGPLPQPWLKEP